MAVRLSDAEAIAIGIVPPQGVHTPKNAARVTYFEGIRFPSGLEAQTYAMLLFEQRRGAISDLERQKTEHLCCGVKWQIDFRFVVVPTGERRWAEAKGKEERDYLIKVALWRAFGLGPLDIYVQGNAGWPRRSKTVVPDLAALRRDDLQLSRLPQ